MSRIGISKQDFESSTIGEVLDYLDEYRAGERDEYRGTWDLARFQALHAVMPHADKKLKATDIAWFPWDSGYLEQIQNIDTPESARAKIKEWRENVIDKIPDSAWEAIRTQEDVAKLFKDGNATVT